jgi:hypothetical protein
MALETRMTADLITRIASHIATMRQLDQEYADWALRSYWAMLGPHLK